MRPRGTFIKSVVPGCRLPLRRTDCGECKSAGTMTLFGPVQRPVFANLCNDFVRVPLLVRVGDYIGRKQGEHESPMISHNSDSWHDCVTTTGPVSTKAFDDNAL